MVAQIINTKEEICDLDWLLMKQKPSYHFTQNKTVTLVDLFCGCGGLSFGVKEALRVNRINLDVKLALDVNTEAINVYKNNFNLPDNKCLNNAIENILDNNPGDKLSKNETNLQINLKDLDIVVAGPPCQGHSDLNNNTRRNDPRNKLYLKAIRFIELIKPKIAILENVPTVVHDKNNVIQKSLEILKDIGYSANEILINFTDIGIPQTRKRHFIIAILDYSENTKRIINFNSVPYSLKDYIGDLEDEYLNYTNSDIFFTPSTTQLHNMERISYLFKNNLFDLPDSKRPNCHKLKKHSYKSMYGRLNWDKPAQTITSGFGSIGQGRYIHPSRKRVITPHEAARLQGFPDYFNFASVQSRVALHEMIANAVPPKITALIINALIKKEIL